MHRFSRLVQIGFTGVFILGFAAALSGLLFVWSRGAEVVRVAAAGPTVLITANGFEPEQLVISPGEVIGWLNGTNKPVEIGNSRHCYQYLPLLMQMGEGGIAAARSSRAGSGWGSGAIAPGDIYSTTFPVSGDYPVYLDCRYDVLGMIQVYPATPSATPTHSPTSSPIATFTPTFSPTPSPSITPTPTFGPSPTTGFCPIQFESSVRAGDQFVPVTGNLYPPTPALAELYWIPGTGSNVLIAQTILGDYGPGHLCPGSAEFYIDPSQFILVAGMLLVVTHTVDASSDVTQVVMPLTATPTATLSLP